MVLNQKEYSNFLKKALEIPTVSRSWCYFANARPVADPDPGSGAVLTLLSFYFLIPRRPLVKKDFGRSKGLLWPPRLAISPELWPWHVQDMVALYPTLLWTCTRENSKKKLISFYWGLLKFLVWILLKACFLYTTSSVNTLSTYWRELERIFWMISQ